MINIVTEIRRAQLLPRVHNRIMRQLNTECMERHVSNRLPKHFTAQAYEEYGARRRSAATDNRKEKRYGTGGIPNVASGKMRDSIRTVIRATPDGARLEIRAKFGTRLPDAEWAKMSPKQRNDWNRKNSRRMSRWQKREIAAMSKQEIFEERKRLAIDYRIAALSPKNKRQRKKRTR